MNRKETVLKALRHEEPGAVPIDFGSTAVTGMHVSCVEAVRKYYGLDSHPVKVVEPFQMLGELESDLMELLGISTIGLPGPRTLFGFRNEGWREFKTPWGQIVLVPEMFNTTTDSRGDLFIYPEGDTTIPPSGHMPNSGYFFDAVIRQEKIIEARLNPEDNLEEFELISDEDLAHYQRQAEQLENVEQAVVSSIGGTAIGDIALVPGTFLKNPKGIRDIEEWYISIVARTDYLHQVFSRQSDIALENLQKVHSVVGDRIDVLFLCGTDFGTQNATFCSRNTYEELYHPYYKKMTDWLHRNTNWKIFKHSCGSVINFMDLFIESGFDIINPVQCSAAGMDPKTLKSEFGDHIVFWGGGAETQNTLAFQSPEEVRFEVLERCKIFSENGGFVFNSVHNIQPQTPVDNIVAMFNAIREFNGQ